MMVLFRVGSDQKIFNTLASHNLVQIPVLFPRELEKFSNLFGIYLLVRIAFFDLGCH